MHATSVIIGTRGVLIRGKSGAGKSSLALNLIEDAHIKSSYASLVSDDQTILANVNGQLLAYCPGTIGGRIEIRGYGIVKQNYLPSAIIHLVVSIIDSNEIERMPQQEHCNIEGVRLPQISVPCSCGNQATRMIMAMLAINNFNYFS